ncbi:MAG: hypothetical protein JNL75_00200 [Chitinophagales bacterium]|nr:hypothetical protein [Chitinophagales bacterium]
MGDRLTAVWQNGGFSAKFNGSSSIKLLCKTEHLYFDFRHFAKLQNGRAHAKFPAAQMAHLVLPKAQANAQKTKRAIFCQRTDRRQDIKSKFDKKIKYKWD